MGYQVTPSTAAGLKMDHGPEDPIVIVGAACRLAGEASSLENLWNMMKESRTAHAKVPKERWDADAWYHPDPDRKGSLNTTHGFFLKQDIAAFDAPFFTVNAKEAAGMDPAKRLLLEVAYETFENAGMPMEKIAGSKTGVYIGSMTSDYEVLSTREIFDEPHMAAAGSSEAMTANRVSWFFDLRGPSLTLDTACSSSLYALHLACQSLRLGETNMGLVAGVSVMLHPNFMQQLVAMHMLSPDGTSHTFDSRANGYGRGEGIGAVVLKRLSDAIRDGDTIRAVIRGIGSNVDGKTPSVTMPSAEAQANLIREVYENAKLPMSSTPYVELHGTGTPVGDPIELSAIAETFGAAAPPNKPVYVGSIKPNVGHTEGCAGLAGVFKAMLSLERGLILPTAEVETLNPKLTLDDWNIALPQGTLEWPANTPRRISVNSFGFGGANAHVILDGASQYLKEQGLEGNASDVHFSGSSTFDKRNGAQDTTQQKLFLLSSRDAGGVSKAAKMLGAYLETQKNTKDAQYLSKIAFTLNFRRSELEYRSCVVADSVSDLALKLATPDSSMPRAVRRSTKQSSNRIAFIFTGQGAQWAGMGRQLFGQFEVFTQSIARSSLCLAALGCPFNLEDELQRTEMSKIETAEFSQPICTAVQVALVDLLQDWKVVPGAVVGHSSGEIAAAYAAHLLTHEDAIKVAYLRGVYSQVVSNSSRCGAMLAAGISEVEAQEYLKAVPPKSAVVACVNSPKSVTLSGDADAVTQLETAISADQKFARKLRVTTAYHSPHMTSVAEGCLEAMQKAGVGRIAKNESEETSIPMFSSVTGELLDPAELDATYWIRNMCGTVRFSPAVTSLLVGKTSSAAKRRATGRKPSVNWDALVEIGPHSALKAPLVQIMEEVDVKLPKQLAYTSLLVRKENAVATALGAAGALWAAGLQVALDRVNRNVAESASIVAHTVTDLPSYAWNHDKTFWHESPATKQQRLQSHRRTDLLGAPIENQNPLEPQWRNHLRVRENPWVGDHKITGTILYPGAGMLIMVIEAVADMAKDRNVQGVEFTKVRFEKGLVIPSDGATETILRIQLPQSSTSSRLANSFAIFSRINDGPWVKNCHGRFHVLYADTEAGHDAASEDSVATLEWKRHINRYETIKQLSAVSVDVTKFYDKLYNVGMQYGTTFQNVTELRTVPERKLCYGAVKIPDTKSTMPSEYQFPHLIHPATLDAIFHLIVSAVAGGEDLTEAAVPSLLEKLYISFDLPHGAGQEFVGYAERVDRRDGKLCADLVVSDRDWKTPKVIVKGLVMTHVSADSDGALHFGQGAVARKTATIKWKVDPSLSAQISSAGVLANISTLRDWLEIECHKSAKLSVAVMGQTLSEKVLNELLPFLNDSSPYRGISQLTVTDTSKDALELWRKQPELANIPVNYLTKAEWTESNLSCDVVIVGSTQADADGKIHMYQDRITVSGRIVILDSYAKAAVSNGVNGTNGSNSTNGHSGGDRHFLKLQVGDAAPLAVYTQKKPQNHIDTEILLLVPSINNPSQGANLLLDQLNRGCVAARFIELKDAAAAHGSTILSLLDGSLLSRWSSEEFQHFQAMVASASHICWLTSGAQFLQSSKRGLDFGAIPGLLRVLRNEFPQVTLSHLDLSFDPNSADEGAAKLVVDTFCQILRQVAEDDIPELEIAELNGNFLIPRVVEDGGMDLEIALSKGNAPPLLRTLDKSAMLELIKPRTQGAKFCWRTPEVADGALTADEVEVVVSELSVYPLADSIEVAAKTMGSLVSGTVRCCGANVVNVKAGDHVVVLGLPSCKTVVRQHHSRVFRVSGKGSPSPAKLWIELMATYILESITHLAAEETILVQDANSHLGRAIITRATKYGARVQAIVSTAEEKSELMRRTRIDQDSITVQASEGSASVLFSHILEQTHGEGVDVAIQTGNGPPMDEDAMTCFSDFARVAVILGPGQEAFAVPVLAGNVTWATVDPLRVLLERPRLLSVLLSRMNNEADATSDEPRTTFPVSELAKAIEGFQSGKSNDFVSISLANGVNGAEQSVHVIPPAPRMPRFDANATYILAGGLGSLGVRVAELMAKNGAKHLVFLSRSGGNRHNDKLSTLHLLGCQTLVLACDVTSPESVQNMIAEVKKTERPIKGLLQCAMVLQDSLFEKMTLEQWQIAFMPKVEGSWNLHLALPEDIDFFVMLSSVVSVIGNVAQANYAAGNSYMDALAQYRRSLGLPATSINAGLVSDSDHIIDGTSMEDYLERFKHMASVSTTLSDLDIAVAASMRGTVGNNDTKTSSQFVFCMSDSLQPTGVDFWAADAKFIHRVLRESSDSNSGSDGAQDSSIAAIGAATTREDCQAAIQDVMKKLLAPGMGLQPADIDVERPLYELGVDSFKAVEVRNQIYRQLKCEVSVFEVLSPNSLAYLVDQLITRSPLVPAALTAHN